MQRQLSIFLVYFKCANLCGYFVDFCHVADICFLVMISWAYVEVEYRWIVFPGSIHVFDSVSEFKAEGFIVASTSH